MEIQPKNLFAPPDFKGDDEKTRSVGILNGAVIILILGEMVPKWFENARIQKTFSASAAGKVKP